MADIQYPIPDPHTKEAFEVCKLLGVDHTKGLTEEQVNERRAKFGFNETPAPPKTPYWELILAQFEDLLVRILLAAAIISFVLACFEEGEESTTAFVEPFVILLILICNAIVGVWQESNAEAAIEALKKYISTNSVVLRDGDRPKTIPARELVPGDIIKVVVGDQIPADCRVLELNSTTLRVDQSILTGESVSIMKGPEVSDNEQDRTPGNMIYAGTSVAHGKGLAVVTCTGLGTEYGKIEKAMRETEDQKTPLKQKLDDFGDLLTKVIGVICILVWLVNIGHFTDPVHGGAIRGAVYYFKIAVALAVAAIPEGLPAVVTTCLALGTRKMAKKNALVRSLPSVETLGCTTVICSDKTGTLTTNMMSVAKVVFFGSGPSSLVEADVEDTRFQIKDNTISLDGRPLANPIATQPQFADIARVCALCNDSSLAYDRQTHQVSRVGEATEAALRVLVEKIGLPQPNQLGLQQPEDRVMACNTHWEGQYQKEATLEFARDRKSMSTYYSTPQGNMLFCKGAPEMVLERCTSVKMGNGDVVPLTPQAREVIMAKIKEISAGKLTLRCLGLAIRTGMSGNTAQLGLEDTRNFVKVESDMTFVGVVGMLDPPRPEVRDSIVRCQTAGIRVIVITGDNKDTAEAICRRIGIFSADENTKGKAFTGAEFDAMSQKQKEDAIKTARLFSRTDPTHKMALVDLLQKQGAVCAMTGDGVNDAPALKKADIGIAMGLTGTEVAKAASKMVLSDDNFSTIVSAVEEGRAIYNNTKQFIRYLISSNIGEVVCIFLTAALGMPEALVPVQLLWVNLVTDGFPATALGFNPADKNIMNQRPRKSTEPIVNGWLFARYLIIGVYVGVVTVGGFAWWFMFFEGGPQISWADLAGFHSCVDDGTRAYSCSIFHNRAPSTVSLSVLVTVEMFNALNALSEDESLFSVGPFVNKWLLLAISVSFSLHFAILYTPILRTIFGVTALGWPEWQAVILMSFPVIIVDEVLKAVSRALSSGKKVKTE
eukprot:TRINITY_DN67074_c8_g1_i1.p1 TRINITY_DN67074_c8_g1~~TRINITY_DN67074_c8_g1_i1.p1  ORF type:complete len:1023 (-),score=153.41 TRINITY_DN67074_c8_g1_i1:1721-4720(-)